MRARALVAVLPLLVAGLCPAQQAPAFSGSVVVTATSEEQPESETAAASTVITAEELRSAGVFGTGELLRRVPGVTLLRSGGDNGVTSLFVRGTGSAHTLVLLDGVRLSSPFFGGYDWSVPTTLGVGRVEVVRGPYSALYGADALGGVVQIVPARASGTQARMLAEAGEAGWRRGEVEAQAGSGQWSVLAGATDRTGSGPLANDDFASRAVLADVGYDLDGAGRIAVLLRRTTARTGIPFVGATATPRRRTSSAETLAALPVRLRLGADSTLEATLSRVERGLVYRDPDDATGFVSGDTQADSDAARVVLHTSLLAHRLAAGAEWRRDRVDDRSSFGVNLAGRTLTTASLFVQDGVALGRHGSVLVGLRQDRARPWGDELSPRVTLGWKAAAWRSWLSLGRAFRAPSLGELYFPFSGNPDLAPERSRSAELGLALPLARGGRLSLVAFANRASDLVEFDYLTYRFANLAHAAQDGVEASLSGELGGGASGSLALTWLQARDGGGRPLLRRPRWTAATVLRAPLPATATAELSIVLVGARTDVDPVSFARVGAPAFVTADMAVAAPLAPWLSLRLRAENVADRAYQEVRGYPAPRRRLLLGVETVLR